MIIVKLSGGLGNQMFQYCMGLNLAEKLDTEFCLDTSYLLDRSEKKKIVFRDYDLPIFQLSNHRFRGTVSKSNLFLEKHFNKLLPTNLKSYIVEETFLYQPKLNHLARKDIYLDGVWQSPKYFETIKQDVFKAFSFSEDFDDNVRVFKSKIDSVLSICLNVRRADFVNNDFHGTMEVDYYAKAIEELSSRVNNNKDFHIFIFSDDLVWCKENLHFDYPTTFVEHDLKGRKFSSYLYLMQQCKYFIIPNSSFAWWAAWLCAYEKKVVIAPKVWFKSGLDAKDLIPESWVRL
ncbi:MAG TPA: alpha-1,2-fucosyltransferase [Pedobacter sp.]|jgi:hypothetical protein